VPIASLVALAGLAGVRPPASPKSSPLPSLPALGLDATEKTLEPDAENGSRSWLMTASMRLSASCAFFFLPLKIPRDVLRSTPPWTTYSG